MQFDSFTYKTSSDETITIKYDLAAVTTGGGGHTDEPAWSYRLWNGSIYLSRYLESIAPALQDKVVIDMGCGTGLTSIVLGKCCGVKRVYATDLSHAMPLLSHNIAANMSSGDSDPSSPLKFSEKLTPTCPAKHELHETTAECEGYMCNLCSLDIDEDGTIYRCSQCNFDICDSCQFKISTGDTDSLPEWFRLHIESAAVTSNAFSNMASHIVLPVVFDWASPDSMLDLVHKVHEGENMNGTVKYIIGADVTYSIKSIELFFDAVTELTASLRNLSSSLSPEINLLFSHHDRSDDTNNYLQQQLRFRYEGKHQEIAFQQLGQDDREDAKNESLGDMKIIKVLL